MTNKLVIFLSGTALFLAGCGKHDGANDASNDASMTVPDNGDAANAAAETALNAQGFINAAAASDKFEIESSKLAASAGASSAVKSFAANMISAHEASTAKLKTTTAAMSPALMPDATLSAEQQQTLDSLKGLKGAEFDKAYATAQIGAHQKALDTLNAYVASGDNSQLQDFAQGMVPTVTAHLNMAKSLG